MAGLFENSPNGGSNGSRPDFIALGSWMHPVTHELKPNFAIGSEEPLPDIAIHNARSVLEAGSQRRISRSNQVENFLTPFSSRQYPHDQNLNTGTSFLNDVDNRFDSFHDFHW